MAIGSSDEEGKQVLPAQAGGLQSLDNVYSLDGDDLINDFYATAENINLRDALISNGLIRPAGTMVMLNGENLCIVNTTLDGLSAEDPNLQLGPKEGNSIARLNNISLENCNNGQIDIQNAIVDGLTVGGNVTINLNGGQLNNFRVTEDSNIVLRTNGGTLNRVKLDGAHFDDRSSFANAVIRGGEITNCDFRDVDFTRADLSDVHITGGEISGKFGGAMLRNMSINADIRGMEVSESTTFHNVNVFDPSLNQYRNVGNLDQFRAIQRSYELMDQVRDVGIALNQAIQQTPPAPEPAPEGVEFKQTNALVSNPQGIPSPSANEPVRMAAGGDAPANETSNQTLARLGAAISENFGQPVVNATQNDVRVQEHNTQEATKALNDVLAAKVAAAMDGFSRGDGRS